MFARRAAHTPCLAWGVGLLCAAWASGCALDDGGGSAGLGATTSSPYDTSASNSASGGHGTTGASDAGRSGTTGGFCFPNGVFVGPSDPSVCCSDELDSMGYCGNDGGIPVTPCPAGCDNRAGFHCEAGTCVLNGDDGELQFTLNWENHPRTPEDLDLHVVEPGGCEIWWGHRQCVGKLDLDANAGCDNTDPDGGFGADVENIIYAPGTRPPAGTYVVRVDYWDDCDRAPDVLFTVKARIGDGGIVVHDHFSPSEADNGGPGSGKKEITFSYP